MTRGSSTSTSSTTATWAGSEALVVLVYDVQDDAYYDCAETTYTAGYFAPDYLTSTHLNVIVIDALRLGEPRGRRRRRQPGRGRPTSSRA